jgi:hypothetical protein
MCLANRRSEWRLVASRDRYVPAGDPDSVSPEWEWDQPGANPHTARAMAYLIAQGTSREAEATYRREARNGSDEDRRRKAGFCKDVTTRES